MCMPKATFFPCAGRSCTGVDGSTAVMTELQVAGPAAPANSPVPPVKVNVCSGERAMIHVRENRRLLTDQYRIEGIHAPAGSL